jgi:SNF2 family DNA or RNA helicase
LSFGCAIAMTGTPFENSMMDLWSLSNVVCNDFLGDRATFYRNYVAQGVLELRQNEIDAVEEKLRPILLRRMKTEVLDDLPSKLDIYKPLSMGDTEQRKYNLLEQNIRNNKHDKANALALIAHLRKFTAHPLLLNERLGEASFDDMVMTSSKFSYLATALKTVKLAGEKALVFANHVALLDKFVACFSDVMNVPCWKIDGSISDRQEVIKAFTDVESAAFLFLNPITSGMGLNITAANHVFHYSRQWNPALEEQATARAYRNGQEKSVNAYYFYYADSIEQTIHERIMIKSEIAGDLIKRTQFWADEDELIMSLL